MTYDLVEQAAEYHGSGAARPVGEGCLCVRTHAPAAYVPANHHVIPKSWGGVDDDWNRALICPNTHEAVHHLLDEHVRVLRAGGGLILPWSTLRHFSPFQRDLAARGWAGRPERPTFTLQHAWVA
jgi:hypothetical protein